MIRLEQNDFILTLEFLGCIKESKTVHRYALIDKDFRDTPLFCGSDLQVSPMHEPESPEALEAILGFLAVGRGDVENEYFEGYSVEQLEWLDGLPHRYGHLDQLRQDIEAIAPIFWDIYSLSNEENIPWDDWKEGDDEEGCFPIRLRLFEDQLHLHRGLPDWDTDHRGAIASGCVTQGMGYQEVLDLCLELHSSVLDQLGLS